jgi:hypothetical protein
MASSGLIAPWQSYPNRILAIILRLYGSTNDYETMTYL